jgi:flagellar basal-body rod protein FlgB
MKIFDNTKIPLLSKALDAYSLRHKIISSNIANIGTPGYKAKSVEFENLLNNAAANTSVQPLSTNLRHFDISATPTAIQSPEVVAAAPDGMSDEEMKSGINDVDIDTEMAELAKNQIRFKYVSRLLGESFRGIQKSIKGQV